jgi:hypothetical protein
MKFIAIIFLALSLSGCGIFTRFLPVTLEFPEPVQELTEKCPDLKQIESNQISVTDLLKNITNNYNLYYQCSLKNDEWNNWYKKQKEIYDETKKKGR